MTSAARGFFKLLGLLAVIGIFTMLLFWPHVVTWLSEFFGV